MSSAAVIGSITKAILKRIRGSDRKPSIPPDRFVDSGGEPDDVLNVFLYQTAISPAWRNQDFPRVAGLGQAGRSVLPLNLYYLVTAYKTADGEEAEVALGNAMLKLHDDPILDAKDLGVGFKQVDPIRITPHPLTFDEMSKLWTAFQTPYRLSAAIEVGIVLLESEIDPPSPLPVTRLGESNRGWDSKAQFPAFIERGEFVERDELKKNRQPGVHPGAKFWLVGQNLQQEGAASIALRPTNLEIKLPALPPHDDDAIPKTDLEATIRGDRAEATLPSNWPPGVYLASLRHTEVKRDENGRILDTHTYASNAIPIAVLPQIDVSNVLRARRVANDFIVDLTCIPKLAAKQRAQILIGSNEFKQEVTEAPTENLQAKWPAANSPFRKGEARWARIRVDGVDSVIPLVDGEFNDRYFVKGIPEPT